MLALIKGDEIVSTFMESMPRVDLPDIGQVSPPVDGWQDHGFRIAAVVPGTVPDGHQIVGENYSLVEGVPVQTYTTELIEAPAATVLTPRQARRALNHFGLRAQVDAHVATLSQDDQDDWNFALEIRKDHPVIQAGKAALGLTDEQIDGLFEYGAGID